MAAPTTIDWNYQIRNRPNSLLSVGNLNPASGPFEPTELLFDNGYGVAVQSSGRVYGVDASLTTRGVVGSPNVMWEGPNLISDFSPSLVSSFPFFDGNYYALTLSPGRLAWFLSGDNPFAAPTNWVGPHGTSVGGAMVMHGTHGLALDGASSVLESNTLTNNFTGAVISQARSSSGTIVQDPALVTLECGLTKLTANPTPLFNSYGGIYLTSGLISQPSYAVQSDVGLWGTGAAGDQFSGGLFTVAGSPLTLAGDVTGLLGTTQLSAISGNPVSAPSPTTGYVLTWNGSDWVAAAIPSVTPTMIANDGGSVAVSSVGRTDVTLASAQPFVVTTASGHSLIFRDQVGILPAFSVSDGTTGIRIQPSSIALIGTAGVFVKTDPVNGAFLQSFNGYVYVDGVGNVWINPFIGNGLSFFGVTPAPQQGPGFITTGFTAGSGATVTVDSTFTGGIGTSAYTTGDLVSAAKLYGLLQQ